MIPKALKLKFGYEALPNLNEFTDDVESILLDAEANILRSGMLNTFLLENINNEISNIMYDLFNKTSLEDFIEILFLLDKRNNKNMLIERKKDTKLQKLFLDKNLNNSLDNRTDQYNFNQKTVAQEQIENNTLNLNAHTQCKETIFNTDKENKSIDNTTTDNDNNADNKTLHSTKPKKKTKRRKNRKFKRVKKDSRVDENKKTSS